MFGRRKIYSSLKKDELTAESISKILPSVLRIHDENAQEIDYLWRYYKGEQPILNKYKKVRPDINNKVLENHAYEIVEFKKSNDFGEPVQYVQKGEKDSDKINPEISLLNKYVESEDKSSLDLELSEWQSICGTAYRYIDNDTPEDEDEAPFEMSIPDPRKTFVVYSSGIKGEPLFSGTYAWFVENEAFDNDKMHSNGLLEENRYRIITIYTDEFSVEFKEGSILEGRKITINDFQYKLNNGDVIDAKVTPLFPKGQRIIEYPANSARIGAIELVMTELNAINRIKSDDLDGIDQFVQSLLVFVNQDVDVEDVRALEDAGAIKVFTSDPSKPADVKLLTQQLMHSETQLVVNDLYDKVLMILGIPRMNDKASGGDTGEARLLGEGWTMAYQRAKQDDLNFKKNERRFLKLVLKICKEDSRQGVEKIKDLKVTDIDIKIPREKNANLLVKTQGLMNLLSSGVHPELAFTNVGLFNDPHDVYLKSAKYYGDEFWKSKSEPTKVVENNDNQSKEDTTNSGEQQEDTQNKSSE